MKKTLVAPWHFEGFRRFYTFNCLQQAASVLDLVEGLAINDRVGMSNIASELRARTGLEWMPVRDSTASVTWMVEGSVFRNKKRVLTSTFVLDIEAFDAGFIQLTNFGKNLARGDIIKEECYREIVRRYTFPHPAYEENWTWWTEAGLSLRPLQYLLQLLVHLAEIDDPTKPVTVSEIASVGGRTPDAQAVEQIAREIVDSRARTITSGHTRSDDFDRKLGDMLGFLSMAGYIAKSGRGYVMNPIQTNKETGELALVPTKGLRSTVDEVLL